MGVLAWRDLRRRDRAEGRWSGWDVLWVAAGAAAGTALAQVLPSASGGDDSPFLDWPVISKLVLVLTVGVVEELFFRGFVIERAARVTGRLWVGGVLSFVLFVAAHIGDVGLERALGATTVGSAAFTILYVWRRNLPACILLHLGFNSLVLFAG